MDRNLINVFSIFLLKWTVANGLTEDRVPDPPENVHVRTTSNSATLWWDPPTNGDTVMVRGYAVAYGIGTPTSKIVIEGSNTYSFTINRLKPFTEYVFAVNAYNEAEGEDGEKVLMTAMTQTNTEGESSSFSLWPPIAVRAITKDRGVEVGWEDPNPEKNEENSLATTSLRHYIVQYGIYQSENLQKVRSNSRSVLLNNLLPGREYEIAVKVVDSDGRESPWSIRDIVLTPHDTPSEISRYDWLCDFEKDQCGLKSVGHIHWLRTHRKDNPGPFEGSHYLTLDPHPSNTRSARLVTPTFNMQRSNNLCLQFAFYMRESHDGVFSVGLEDERTFLVTDVLKIDVGKLPKGRWVPVKLNVGSQKTPFKISFKITWKSEGPWTGLDSIGLSSGVCSGIEGNEEMKVLIDQESEVDLLVPVEGALNSDPRVFRAKGIDGLPAIGIQRGVEIVVPYRLYLPRKFFKEFSILVSVKPSDLRGGYLFAVVNPFDTIVDVGVLIEPAGQSQTNISFIYSNSRTDTHSKAIASFLVPEFVQQWAQFALEVTRDEVVLYFKCVRFSARQVSRIPEQLVMDDAHKLYIGSGGPLIGGGFEGAIQELKILDDPAEAVKQCDELWGEDEGSGFGERANDDSGYHPKSDQVVVELPQPPTPPPPPPPSVYSIQEHPASGSHSSAGLRGERGEQGPPGVCSAHCRDGTPGLPGPVGPEGRQGVAGQQGLPGPPGPPGPSGAVSGSYDGSGMRSIPGPAGPPGQSGPQGPQGVQGPRGDPGLPGRDGRSYEGLSDDDIERIVNDPRIKGEKGDSSGAFSTSSQYNSIDGPIEPYDPKKHRNQQKGQKGDPGVPGHPGHPGPAGPPGPPGRDAVGGGVGTVSSSGTAVYQTTVELFAAGRNLREGSLAFVTSSQQLFIRVTNGWKEILLGAFHPILEPRQSVEAPTSSSVPYHPVQAENLYAQADYSRAQNQDSPTSSSSSSMPHQPPHFPHSFTHTEYSRDASRAVQREEYQLQNKDRVLHMIALNTPFSGNMRGLRGADLQCYRQARQAGFGTTFRAMLSSKVQDLFRIVHAIDHNTPVVNLKGEVLFPSWSTVVGDGGVPEGKGVYAFNRQDVFTGGAWPDKRIWHGSTEGGLREDGAFCDGWRTASQYDSGLASTFSTGRPLVGTAEKVSCGSKLIVLCVENMSKYNVERILARKNVHSLD